MRKISTNQITSIVVLIIAAGISIALFYKQNQKINQLQKIQNEQGMRKHMLDSINNLKKKIDKHKDKYKPKEPPEIINTITNIAANSQAKIISLKPREQSAAQSRAGKKVYGKLFFDLGVQIYSYHHLGQFISNLENCPTIFFVIEGVRLRGTQSIGRIREGLKPEGLQAELVVSNLFFQK